jgi:hypothetical protein
MVRLIRKLVKGRIVWVEDAPDSCGNGDRPVLPGLSTCPTCRYAQRVWSCRERCGGTQYDPDHRCRR